MSVYYTETLPATKSSKHSAINWSPAEHDYSPVAGLLTIHTDRETTEYAVTEFPTGWRGRGFHLGKVGPRRADRDAGYDVFCSADGPEADSCDCAGATYNGHCKHVDSVRALLTNGWI